MRCCWECCSPSAPGTRHRSPFAPSGPPAGARRVRHRRAAGMKGSTRSGTVVSWTRSPCQTLRSEEHTSELQSHHDLVCRLLLEKKKNIITKTVDKTTKQGVATRV